MKKKVLSLILILCMVVTLMPLMGVKADAATFSKNTSLYSQNGYGQAGLKIIFDKYSSGEKSVEGGQCFGFAEWCRKTMAASSTGKIRYNYPITASNVKKFKGVNPGTHMRIGKYKDEWGSSSGHSICILKVTDTRVYYVQSNWACSGANKVSYGNDTISQFVSRFGYAYNYITYVNKVKTYKTTGRNPKFTAVYCSNGGTGTMSASAIKFGVATSTKANAFKRSGYTFKGWYVYRPSDGKYYYKKGASRGWYKKGTQPSGYSYFVLPNRGTLAKIVPAGNKVYLYAKWEKNNNTIGLVSEATYYDKYSDSSKYTAVPYYRYKTRTMQTTTSTSPSLSGWDLVTTHISTKVGPWTTTKPSGDYETTQAYYYYSYVCNCQRCYWKSTKSDTCVNCKTKMNNLLRVYSKNDPSKYYKKDTDGSYFTPTTISTTSPGSFGTIYRMTYKGSSISKFVSTSKKNTSFLWPSSAYRVTLYRTKTSSVSYVYQKLSDWSDWSSWTTSYISDSETSYRDPQVKYYITIK